MKPWLTIATVVKDDPLGFASTMQSIHAQSESDFQVLIVDSSAERLVVDQPHSDYHWTPPTGIYPAMNHALSLAKGEYIFFLNAGDTLADADTLHKVRKLLESKPLWAYGLIKIKDPDSGSEVISSEFDYRSEYRNFFARGKFPPHQATFVQTDTLRDIGGFDTTFTITADYAAMLKLSALAEPLYLPEVIAEFVKGGVSDTDWRSASRQFHQARLGAFPLQGADWVREILWTQYFRTKTRIYRASRRARR
jgi:GT2 family glycosyltransferase